MQKLPHRYMVTAADRGRGDFALASDFLPPLDAAAPAEFDGPGDRWSPETLLVGAVAGCFVLTFRAVARASNVSWTSLDCTVDGTLDRIDRATQFTRFDLRARLAVPPGTDAETARRALEKAERTCLITNSLKAPVTLTIAVDIDTAELVASAR
jgi:organic hydroperoxide reductase OsmC/OhrA